VTTWYGVVAPAGTPAPIVNKLNAALNDIVKDKAVQGRIEKAGAVAQGSTVEGFRQHMAAEMARWDKVRENAKIEKQ
jgi:tripartite-type tricarboxylate transporter receptor subunit TctC